MTFRKSAVAPLCLAGAVFFWGTSFVAAKVALTHFSPVTLVWMRMALASVAYALVWPRIPKSGYRTGDWKRLAALCLLQPCLYFLCEANALRLTTSAQAGMISATVPLLVMVGAAIFLGERFSWRIGLGLALSLLGVVGLSGGFSGQAATAEAPNPLLGNLLELCAMFCAAGYMLVIKKLSARYNSWLLTGLQCFAGGLFFLPGALIYGPAEWVSAPVQAWGAVLYLGLVVTIAAFGLYNMALSGMEAGRASLSINLVPLVAVAGGWLLLDERLDLIQAVSGVAVLAGVGLGQSRAGRRPVATPEAVSASD